MSSDTTNLTKGKAAAATAAIFLILLLCVCVCVVLYSSSIEAARWKETEMMVILAVRRGHHYHIPRSSSKLDPEANRARLEKLRRDCNIISDPMKSCQKAAETNAECRAYLRACQISQKASQRLALPALHDGMLDAPL